MKGDKWPKAPSDVECVDIWQPGRFSEDARAAYDRLLAAGRIKDRSVQKDTAGRVIVRYMADCPEQWIREELREAKAAGLQMGMDVMENGAHIQKMREGDRKWD